MRIAIMGATGAVGSEMINQLIEQNIDVTELKLLASAKSAGKQIEFKGEMLTVEELTENSFEGMDIVLGATGNAVAKQFAPHIVKAGAVFIDNSSAFRMNPDVPLIVPEINGADAKNHKGIIANPNCTTAITLMAIYGINKLSEITAIIASSYQAVSGAGILGLKELEDEVKGNEVTTSVFPYQIAFNCIPSIGSVSTDDYSTEEMKMENEGRKIMHLPNLKATCTCVRVPVYRSHSISATVVTKEKLDLDEVRKSIASCAGVQLKDDLVNGIYPMPLDTSNQNDVFVGRIRQDRVFENGIALFCCGDQIRKGAASNAVQIIKCL